MKCINQTHLENPFPFCFYEAFHFIVMFAFPSSLYELKEAKEIKEILIYYLVHQFYTSKIICPVSFYVIYFQRCLVRKVSSN